MTYPSQEADRYQIRLPGKMRDRIKMIAASNHRSMNAEIIFALEKTFGSESEAVTGANFPETTPVAANQTTALQGSHSSHNG